MQCDFYPIGSAGNDAAGIPASFAGKEKIVKPGTQSVLFAQNLDGGGGFAFY
jgi:hypothetical protein